MADRLSLIAPPLGGRRSYLATNTHLARALSAMTVERDEAESREIALHRCAAAMLAQAFGGEIYVDALLLPEKVPAIHTEYNAETGMTRIWLKPSPPQ